MGAVDSTPTTPRPYDPDRWSRRWALVGAALLSVGFLAPRRIGSADDSDTLWAWTGLEREPLWRQIQTLLPIAVVAATADLVFRWRGVKRGIALFAGGVILTFAQTVITCMRAISEGESVKFLLLILLNPVGVAACLAIGSGSHVRKGWPTSRIASLIPGMGGACLLLALTAGLASAVSNEFFTWPRGRLGALVAFSEAVLFAYGALGVWGLRTESTCTRRARAASWMAAFLPGWIVVQGLLSNLLVSSNTDSGQAHAFVVQETLSAVQRGALASGGWILCAVGLSAWIESRLVARDLKQNRRALDRVFR